MAFTEDLADFINADTPGYVLATVGGVYVGGLFDEAYLDPFGVAGSQPALVCARASVSSAVQGTVVVLNAVNYTVGSKKDNPEDLGSGLTRLLLHKV